MLSVIIVDYKTIKKTIKYIYHLEEHLFSRESIHFIVIDNTPNGEGRNDFVRAFGSGIKKRIPDYDITICKEKYVYCCSKGNIGYAKGNNLGSNIARELYSDDLYLISNNDIRLTSVIDTDEICKLMQGDVAVIGPKVIGLQGERQSPYRKPSFFDSMIIAYLWPINHLRARSDVIDTENSCVVYRVIGGFMFVDAKVFHLVNGFDSNTFLYFEESILSEKLSEYGCHTYYYNEIEVVHEHGGTTSKTQKNNDVIKWYYDSAYYYYKKYRGISTVGLTISKTIFTTYHSIRCVSKYFEGKTKKKKR